MLHSTARLTLTKLSEDREWRYRRDGGGGFENLKAAVSRNNWNSVGLPTFPLHYCNDALCLRRELTRTRSAVINRKRWVISRTVSTLLLLYRAHPSLDANLSYGCVNARFCCAFWIQSTVEASKLEHTKKRKLKRLKPAADFTSLWQSDYMSYFKPVQLSAWGKRELLFFLHFMCETTTWSVFWPSGSFSPSSLTAVILHHRRSLSLSMSLEVQ